MKIHLACGDIYLSPDYINVDIKGKLISEVSKKELEKNLTTIDKYFKYPFGSPRRDVIIDKKMDITKLWSFKDSSVEQIIAISTIEHFTPKEASFIISEMKRTLKPNGHIVIDFPDIKKVVDKYYYSNPEFMSLLIYCNFKDNYSVHKMSITPELFKSWWDKKYSIYEEVIVKHDYPMLSYVVIKNE